MSNDINNTTVVGRLTRDSEMKYLNSGTAVCNFSVASSEYVGKPEPWTNYFDCVMFGKRAEALTQYLVKGCQLAVSGSLHQDRWDKDGQNRSKVSIKVSDIQLLGGKGNSDSKPKQNNPDSFDDIDF